MPEQTTTATAAKVQHWNTLHPAGRPVAYWPDAADIGNPERSTMTRTRSPAWLAGEVPLVKLDGIAGGVHLDHVRPIIQQHTADDAARTARDAAELVEALKGMPEIQLVIPPGLAALIIGNLQLALRHPMNALTPTAEAVEAITRDLIAQFPETARRHLLRGFDPSEDRVGFTIVDTTGAAP